jgi:hypothetical protein
MVDLLGAVARGAVQHNKQVVFGVGLVELFEEHLLKVEPLADDPRLYTDEIRIRAGAFTPMVWAIVHLFCRYRQARWRSLARVLADLSA